MDTLISDDIWGARHDRIITAATLIIGILFEQFCFVLLWDDSRLIKKY